MRKLALLSCAALLGAAVSTSASAATLHGAQTFNRVPALNRAQFRPVFTTLPAKNVTRAMLARQAAGQTTIPYFSGKITSPLDHNTYAFQIAGGSPFAKATTQIQYVPIIMRVHFPDGTVLDPLKPGCNDSVSVAQRFFGGPLFQNTTEYSNGINVGNTQLTDAFMRAESWAITQNSNYHVVLSRSGPYNVVDVTAPSGSVTSPGACSGSGHNLGQIDINAFDNIITGLAAKYATATQIPVTFTYNVVETEGGCCIIGYHSEQGLNGGIQVYATGAYTDAGIFSGLQDIGAYTHELGELYNDPFIDNGTPAWGHTGQVPGCQNNLEVGDPLTGTDYTVNYNGFAYHPQELAFFDWFFRTPSHGTAGYYSNQGTFKSAQGACH